MMMGPFAQTLLAGGRFAQRRAGSGPRAMNESDVRKAVEELKQQVDALRKELKNDQEGRAAGRQPVAGSQTERSRPAKLRNHVPFP